MKNRSKTIKNLKTKNSTHPENTSSLSPSLSSILGIILFTSLHFTSSSFPSLSLSLSPQISHMDLYVFLSTDQIELTISQEHSRSPGTIISSPGPMGLLINHITNLNFTVTVI